jgi:O-antigen/teichoic acid export membrane protein
MPELIESGLREPAGYLSESAEAGSIGQRAVRGGVATLSAQSAKFLIQMASTMVLARLLTPQDFGLLAMIGAVTAFLMPFRDMGLSMATLQKAEINNSQISSLFWINAGAGTLLALMLAAFAPLISSFYGQPILTVTIWVFSVKFLLEGLAVQHHALLKRKMQFGQLSLLEVGALAAAAVAAIGAAWTGVGHWALVIQQLTFALVSALGVWVMCPWRPGPPSRRSGVRSMITFGGQVTVANIMDSFSRNFDNVLIGWRWGAEALGLYSKAYALLLLPIRQINYPLRAVVLASLSRLQKEPDRFRQFYCRLLTLLAFTTTPLLVVMAVLSRDIILVLLGEQWVEASTIFTVLAIAALGQPVAGTIGLVNVSLGQSGRYLRWTFIVTPVIMAAFLAGLPWGPLGVAAAYAIAIQGMRFPALWYAFRYAPVKTTDFLKAVWRPFAVSGIMLLFMLGARHYLTFQHPIERLVICCFVGGAALVGAVLVWPETRRQTISLLQQVRELWGRPPKQEM